MLKSTDHNLNNPMMVDELNLYDKDNFNVVYNTEIVTKEEYELIKIKDPNSIYIIKDRYNEIYKGDILIKRENVKNKYLLGTSNNFGEYNLYLNMKIHNHDMLVKICTYNDPQIAINELNKYNNIGYHDKLSFDIYQIIYNFISKNIKLEDMIVGIISLFGYKNDNRLQDLIYNITINPKNIPHKHKYFKPNFLNYRDNILYKYYSLLYDLFEKYKFFKGNKYDLNQDHIDLSDVIREILIIMKNSII